MNHGIRNLFKLAALAGVVVVFAPGAIIEAAARTHHGAVLLDGRVVSASGGGLKFLGGGSPRSFSCQDEEVAFTFSENAVPDTLQLNPGESPSGQITVSVTVNDVCVSGGSAQFAYDHIAEAGEIGADLSIAPVALELSLALEPGDSASTTIDYQVLEAVGDGQDLRFVLRGSRISFVGDDVFGEATRSEPIAEINVRRGPPIDTENPGFPLDDTRVRDAAAAFNAACQSPSAQGTAFGAVCSEVAEEAQTVAQEVQAAEAFDPHELSATPAAAVEGGRIQMGNIESRIASLRGGSTGLSLGGIALAYNGNTFDSSWLPASLSSSAGNGGGSTLLDERLGVFVNGEISLGDRDRRGKEFGFDFDSWGLTAGVDYRFDNGLIAGIAAGYTRYDADLDFDGGKLDSETRSVQLFGTYDVTDQLYLDLTLAAADLDFEQQRVVDLSGIGSLTRTIARGSAGGSQQSGSLAINYRIPSDSRWSFVSYGQAYVARNKIDAFEEHGSPFALSYPEQNFYSRTYTGGVRVSRAVNFSNGVLTPFADASFSHEDGNDGYSMQPALIETGALGPLVEISDPDRQFGQLDAGVSWVFLSGNQLFVRYSGLVGESDTTRHSIHFGARFEF